MKTKEKAKGKGGKSLPAKAPVKSDAPEKNKGKKEESGKSGKSGKGDKTKGKSEKNPLKPGDFIVFDGYSKKVDDPALNEGDFLRVVEVTGKEKVTAERITLEEGEEESAADTVFLSECHTPTDAEQEEIDTLLAQAEEEDSAYAGKGKKAKKKAKAEADDDDDDSDSDDSDDDADDSDSDDDDDADDSDDDDDADDKPAKKGKSKDKDKGGKVKRKAKDADDDDDDDADADADDSDDDSDDSDSDDADADEDDADSDDSDDSDDDSDSDDDDDDDDDADTKPKKKGKEKPAKAKGGKEKPKAKAEEKQPPVVLSKTVKAVIKANDGDVLEAVKAVKGRMESDVLDIGLLLCKIHEENIHSTILDKKEKPVYEPSKKGFAAYVKDELDLEPRVAYGYMDVARTMTALGVDSETVSRIGWTKLQHITDVANAKNIGGLLKKAESNNREGLIAYVRETFTDKGEGSGKRKGSKDKTKKLSLKFSVHGDQANMVKTAIKTAKEEAGTEDDGQAVVHIIQEWSSMKFGTEDDEAGDDSDDSDDGDKPAKKKDKGKKPSKK